MKSRSFSIKRVNNEVFIKGSYSKYFGATSSETTTLAIDSSLKMVEPVVEMNKQFLTLSEIAQQANAPIETVYRRLLEEGKTLLYPLSKITYICIKKIDTSSKERQKKVVSVYVPKGIDEKRKLVCDNVTIQFNQQLFANL